MYLYKIYRSYQKDEAINLRHIFICHLQFVEIQFLHIRVSVHIFVSS